MVIFLMKKKLSNSYISSGEVSPILFFLSMVKCLIGNEGEKREDFVLLHKIPNIRGQLERFHFLALPLNNCFLFHFCLDAPLHTPLHLPPFPTFISVAGKIRMLFGFEIVTVEVYENFFSRGFTKASLSLSFCNSLG